MKTLWQSLVHFLERGMRQLTLPTLVLHNISLMLYSSTDPVKESRGVDANSYPPFKQVDTTVIKKISDEMDALADPEEEGMPSFASLL